MASGHIVATAAMQDAGFIGTTNRFITTLSSFASKLTATQAALIAFGVTMAAVLVTNMIKARREMRQFEVETAELSKVLNSVEEGRGIANLISRLSTELPVARSELMAVGAQAARLGIRGSKNIEEFVRVSAMIGTATDLSAEQAADAFARIMKQTGETVDDYERLAGVMNALANQMATTDSEIVEATRRSAPNLADFGLSADEILAINAALNEVSESATRAGTRLRMFAQNLTDPNKMSVFAEALEMNVAEFRKLAEEDPRGTILQIVEAFNQGGKAADVLATKLESRVRLLISALGANIDGLNQSFAIMEAEGAAASSSILSEFQIFANTLESADIQLANMRQELRRTTLGSFVQQLGRGFAKTELFWLKAIEGKKELEDLSGNIAVTQAYAATVEEVKDAWVAAAQAKLEAEGGPTPFDPEETPKGLERAAQVAADRVTEIWREAMEESADPDRLLRFAGVLNRTALAGLTPDEITDNLGQIRMAGHRFNAMLEEIEGNTARGTKEFDSFAQAQFNVVDALAQSGLSIRELNSEIPFLTNNVQNYVEKIDPLKRGSAGWSESAAQLILQLERQNVQMTQGAVAAVVLTDAWKTGNDEQKKRIVQLTAQIEANKAAEEAEKEHTKALKEQAEQMEKQRQLRRKNRLELLENIEAVKERIQQLRAEAEALRSTNPEAMLRVQRTRELKELEEEMIENNIPAHLREERIQAEMARHASEDHAKSIKDVIRQSKTLGDLMRENSDQFLLTEAEAQFDLLTSSIQKMGDAAGDVFDVMIGKTGDFGAAMIDMFQSIARAAFEQQIMQWLFQALGGGFEGFQVGGGPFPEGTAVRSGNITQFGEPPRFNPMLGDPLIPNLTPDDLNLTGGQMSNVTIVHNHHNNIEALDGPSVRQILVRERETVAGITMTTINRSRTMKKSGVM